MHIITELVSVGLSRLNWIDWMLILASLFFIVEGYTTGFVSSFFDIATFLLAFISGLKLYRPSGDMLATFFHLQPTIAHALAFVSTAIIIEMILRLLEARITRQIKQGVFLIDSNITRINHILGTVPGLFSGLVLFAFLLTALTILPFSIEIKHAVDASSFGKVLVDQTQNFEQNLNLLVGGKANSLLTFYTVEPEVSTSVSLGFNLTNAEIDTAAQNKMLVMVNQERQKAGLPPLTIDYKLQNIAIVHAQDMLFRGYFSHNTPEGKTPFDRMNDAGIAYQYAGENLALSANVDTSMAGLMHSPGHKANILSPNFQKIGIGVLNAGVDGEMFAQEFTD